MNSSDTREWLSNGCVVPLESSAADPQVWIGWGDSRRAAAPEAGRLSVYAPDFFLRDREPWRVYPCSSQVHASELIRRLGDEFGGALADPAGDKAFVWDSPRLDAFADLFTDLEQRIVSGELKKGVPVVFSRAHESLSESRLARTIASALDASAESPLRVYGFWDRHEGMIGATPELLFRCTGPKSISTAAVAGTRPHAARADARLPLLDDPKEVEEHQFVLDGIREAFERMGTVRVGPVTEMRLLNFSHLFASVDVDFEIPEPFDAIVRALHPTPAVGAWPRAAGERWLERMDRETRATNGVGRNRFGAPFGAVSVEGQGICWVAIRGMQWTRASAADDPTLTLAAGCGVTGQSELHREWHELGIKLQAIRTALGL